MGTIVEILVISFAFEIDNNAHLSYNSFGNMIIIYQNGINNDSKITYITSQKRRTFLWKKILINWKNLKN